MAYLRTPLCIWTTTKKLTESWKRLNWKNKTTNIIICTNLPILPWHNPLIPRFVFFLFIGHRPNLLSGFDSFTDTVSTPIATRSLCGEWRQTKSNDNRIHFNDGELIGFGRNCQLRMQHVSGMYLQLPPLVTLTILLALTRVSAAVHCSRALRSTVTQRTMCGWLTFNNCREKNN